MTVQQNTPMVVQQSPTVRETHQMGHMLFKLFSLLIILLIVCTKTVWGSTTVGGTISTDTTWTVANSPYVVTSNITVQGTDGADGITTLTVDPGVQVRFDGAYELIIGGSSGGPGALIAQGTEENPILFTSNAATPQPGDWKRIHFQNTTDDATTTLDYCIIEYYANAARVTQSSPTIKNTIFRRCATSGVYINGGSPTLLNNSVTDTGNTGIKVNAGVPIISGNTFSGNANYDIYIVNSSGATITDNTLSNNLFIIAGSIDAMAGNTVDYNPSFPIRIFADWVGRLLSENSFNNVPADTLLQVIGGTVSSDATWTPLFNYQILGNITVQGIDSSGGTNGFTALTIEPGVQVRFDGVYELIIGASSGNPGALIAQGAEANKILFTSNAASPQPGDWKRIYFNDTTDDAASVLEHCIVEYNANSTRVYKCSPTIKNTVIRSCATSGIYVKYGTPILFNNTITDTGNSGIKVNAGTPIISGNSFSGNPNYDIYVENASGGTITDNTLSSNLYFIAGNIDTISGNTLNYNPSFPIRIFADWVGRLLSENSFNNVPADTLLQVIGGTVSSDATWTPLFNYQILGNITVQGIDSSGGTSGVTALTIEPGVQVRFGGDYELTIGASSGNPGSLIAQGTEANPILFTANTASPQPGDWKRIHLQNTTDDATTTLDYCIIEYYANAARVTQSSPTIKNTIFRRCATSGVYINGGSPTLLNNSVIDTGNSGIKVNAGAPIITCNTLKSNQYGIYWTSSQTEDLQRNNFINNTSNGIYYTGSNILNAEDNWWGDAAGPNGGGDSIHGNVDADPWSTAENQCTTQGENHPPNEPNTPNPADQAVRVPMESGVVLHWSGDDPDPLDTVTYDLNWGTSTESMAPAAQAINATEYTITNINQGLTYYWQIIARDNHGLETSGPVWQLTTDGDPPDLVISQVVTNPPGNLQPGQSVTFIATILNSGSGPVVDAFEVEFKVDNAAMGTAAVNQILGAGQSVQVSQVWTYAGGDPAITVMADNQGQVSETDETNNSISTNLMAIADNSPPNLVGTLPTDGSHLPQLQQISVTLADSQSTVDDAAVMASFTVTDANQQSISGLVSESNDTFTFVPNNLPLTDGAYQASFSAVDIYGNTQNLAFNFSIDTQPPAKPVITGGEVDSGTIRVRPVQNTSSQFIVEVTGTRDPGTSVWINGSQQADTGDTPWQAQLPLLPGANAIKIWLVDMAGLSSEPEWVDITVHTNSSNNYEYDASGRLKTITPNQ